MELYHQTMATACRIYAMNHLKDLELAVNYAELTKKEGEAKRGQEERLPGQYNSLGVMAFISAGGKKG